MSTRNIAMRLRQIRQEIDLLRSEVNAIAEACIPDFSFLDHRVSLFWECDASPVGMCVFNLDENGRTTECRYCGDPEERK